MSGKTLLEKDKMLDKTLDCVLNRLTLYSIDTHIDATTMTAFENIVGKGEIARNEQLLLFPQCF